MNRQEAYTNLADLIFKGFLTAEMLIANQSLILKTVNEKEYDLIKMYTGSPTAKNYQAKFNIYFLIFSLFVLENQNILYEREKKISELYDFFLKLPEVIFRKMIEELNKIRATEYEVLKYIEGFSYTNISRNAWRALHGNLPTCSEFTGIPGTSEMGLNVHQESWIVINQALDVEEDYNRQFSLALMISSASNPKGSRHLRSQHDSVSKSSEDRRQRLAKEGYIDVKKWSPEGWAAPVDTVEELVAELDRQMTGQKDKHDLFIENYLKNIRDQAEKKTREAEERIKRAQEGRDSVLIDGYQKVLTPEETSQLFIKKQPTTTMVEAEEVTTLEDKNKFYKKIGAKVLTGSR